MVLMKKPSVSESPSGRAPDRAPDGISRRQKLAAAEKYFRRSLPWFWIIRGFIGGRNREKEPWGPTSLLGAPEAAARGLVASPGALCLGFQALCVSSVPEKKSFRRFYSVWTPFDILI